MTPHYTDATVTLYAGDCIDVLAELPDASVDAVVTDPPAGISFMSKGWDHHKGGREQWSAWLAEVMREAYRVCKPGAHAFVWALPRTSHWTACGIEDAGWEIRDRVVHLFGTGFPKSHNLPGGLGTALKPAAEDWWLARKPLTGTVASNVTTHGTGALNIAACRIGDGEGVVTFDRAPRKDDGSTYDLGTVTGVRESGQGRWPANVVLDDTQAHALNQMSGEVGGSGGTFRDVTRSALNAARDGSLSAPQTPQSYGVADGASRFFYVAKADASERIRLPKPGGDDNATSIGAGMKVRACNTCGSRGKPAGGEQSAKPWPTCGHDDWSMVEQKPPSGEFTAHPTVKPLALMRWLVRLVTPPGGTILEPFAGSGTTVEAAILEGFNCIAIEREPDYLPLITQRINRRRDPVAAVKASGDDGGLFDLLDVEHREPDPDTRAGEATKDKRYTADGGTNFAMKPGRRYQKGA